MVEQQIKHVYILQAILKVLTHIPLSMEFNKLCGHQDDRIPAQLLDRLSQIKIECNILKKLLVK